MSERESAIVKKFGTFLDSNGLSPFSKRLAQQWFFGAMKDESGKCARVCAWVLQELNNKRATYARCPGRHPARWCHLTLTPCALFCVAA